MLQISGLSKQYGRLTALTGVSFSVRDGEVLGVIGPNGSGKTTLFECLGGVLPSDAGDVLLDGRKLSAAERRAAFFYLPDLIAPWPSQTVRWALDFAVGYWGLTPPAADVIGRFELRSLLDSRIGTLSKGQRKRVVLAIGMLTPQPILLADEPFDGLDLRQTREVAGTLRQYAAAGRTMVLSIHQISDAARVCDRFVLLSGGRVCGEGTARELAARVSDRSDRSDRSDHSELEEIFLALT